MKSYTIQRYINDRREVCVVIASSEAEAIGITAKKFGSTGTDHSEWHVSASFDISKPIWVFHAFV